MYERILRHSPRHQPAMAQLIADHEGDSIEHIASAVSHFCEHHRLCDVPNPFLPNTPERAEWTKGFANPSNHTFLRAIPVEEDAPDVPADKVLPDFAKMTKANINDWLAENLNEAINQRMSKAEMAEEAALMALAAGYQ